VSRRLAFLLFSGVCGSLAVPVAAVVVKKPLASAKPAAPAAPARPSVTAPVADSDGERQAMARFADCIVTEDTRRASQYRDMRYDDARGAVLLRDIASNGCLRFGELSKSTDMLRGAIFKSFYQREQKNASTMPGEVPANFTAFVRDAKAPESMRYLARMDFGACVVRADPANARSLTLATPGGQAEKAALVALRPSLGACVPSGLQVALTKTTISSALAEALYRETQAGQATLAGVAK